jgi:hypothetical protein
VTDLVTLPRIILCISGVGVVLVNHYKNKCGFAAFGLSAALWVYYDWDLGIYEQAITNAISSAVSFYALVRWWWIERRDKKCGG